MPDAIGELVDRAASRWGASARSAVRDDVLQGTAPEIVLAPDSVSELAEMLRWANADRLAIIPRGGGTKWTWGPRPDRFDAVVSLERLRTPIEHSAGDLVATLPAGATLALVNETLGRERQWLPLDPLSGGHASIGGIVATNESGPRRLRHGAPRDLILGVEMVLADGTVARAGGRVVKNVSGYDLARMLCGSWGTLAVVTRATFKLAPRPPASLTVVASASTPAAIASIVAAVAGTPCVPSAIEVAGPPWRLLVRFESTARATRHQAEQVGDLMRARGAEIAVVEGASEEDTWASVALPLRSAGSLARLIVPPSSLTTVLEECARASESHRLPFHVMGRATLGALTIGIAHPADSDSARVPATMAALHEAAVRAGGVLVALAVPPLARETLPAWGATDATRRIVHALKQTFDPSGTLSPGRGPA
jgi:glycolate oxidase FAD binding subunit